MEILLYAYIIAVNIAGIAIVKIDKMVAELNGEKVKNKKSKYTRVPESFLMLTALFFGALGVFLGMMIFRHKTQKIKFIYGVPLIFVLNLVALFYLLQCI